MSDKDYFGVDKLYHFTSCLVASVFHPMFAVGCAVTKEWCDSKANGNHWCWWDLLADALGIVIGSIIHYL